MFEVKDGARTLQFHGQYLAGSTSWRHGSTRWIEFDLYKTDGGMYVLSRVGVSLVYHGAACPIVKKYGLQEVHFSELEEDALPCETCDPAEEVDLVFPEKDRYWAQVSEEPKAVLDALYKYDEGGAQYLTYVAKRLLEDASRNDSAIHAVYKIEVIP